MQETSFRQSRLKNPCEDSRGFIYIYVYTVSRHLPTGQSQYAGITGPLVSLASPFPMLLEGGKLSLQTKFYHQHYDATCTGGGMNV